MGTTIASIASEARSLFTNTDTRKSEDTGRNIWTVADHEACPAWVKALCREAHTDADGGDMMPDDWRYEMLVEALDILADSEDEDYALERIGEAEAPVYSSERTRWLSSHLWRASYCDEACEEYGADSGVTTLDRIAFGYLYELRRVFDVALEACKAEVDARDEAEALAD